MESINQNDTQNLCYKCRYYYVVYSFGATIECCAKTNTEYSFTGVANYCHISKYCSDYKKKD